MISVGIDIGSFSIKVAEVEPTSKGYSIRSVREFPLSSDPTKDKKIEIIDTLRTLFSHYDSEQTQFVFALPQRFISGRLLNFPFRERFKIQKAAISLLEDELPFSQEDAIFDAKIVRYIGKGADVLSMAVPRERVSEVIDLAHDCGVEPFLISSETLGLYNLFEKWDQAPLEVPALAQDLPTAKPAEIIVDLGHSSTKLIIHSEGMLLGIRTVDWGGKNLAEAIAQKYGLNYLQALLEIQQKGFLLIDKSQGTREQAAFSEAIENSLQHLIADMRLKMLELQSEMNLQWTKGTILGGSAQLKNLGAFLTQKFQIPFNKYKQFEHHPPVAFETTSQMELASGTAIGLALEGLRRPRNPATNFLKDEFAPQSHAFQALWQKWGHTVRVLGLGFGILLVYCFLRESFSLSLLEKSDEVLRRQAEAIAKIKGSQASPARIQKFIRENEKLEKNRKQAERVVKINSAMDILNRISTSMPAREQLNLEIKRLSINAETVELHGYTEIQDGVSQIQKVLQSLANNGKTEAVPLLIKIPEGKVGFAFRFRVNRLTGG